MPGKLGKGKPEFSSSDFPMRALLKPIPVPPQYDFDATHPELVYPMFGNDQYGNCVMAGRAHQTLRFELIERKAMISITDKEVLQEYFKQTDGVDSGLIVSRSLRAWRKSGWIAGGGRLFAKAYARISHWDPKQVQASIYSDVGVGVGFSIPNSAIDQFDNGQTWDVVKPDGGDAGGHYVYMPAYDSDGSFTCVTWGKRQKMTRAFFLRYADEAWAVWDAENISQKMKLHVDMAKLDDMLTAIA